MKNGNYVLKFIMKWKKKEAKLNYTETKTKD